MTHSKTLTPISPSKGSWVQVERKALEIWGKLAIEKPAAAGVMMVMLGRMGKDNALVCSQQTLGELCGCSLSTVKRSLTYLRENDWIEQRQIGLGKGAHAYVVNARLGWQGKREGIRYSLFNAQVCLSETEQNDSLENDKGLQHIPEIFAKERIIPTGEGLEPPHQPFLEGLEPEPPTRNYDPETGEILD